MQSTRYKPYPRYKDSGVEWLGKIPEKWEAKRLKFLLDGRLSYGASEASEFTNPDWPRFIRITDLNDDGTLRDGSFRSLPPDIAQHFLLRSGDLLFARSGAVIALESCASR
jgi:type I restriction enzyme S subunit